MMKFLGADNLKFVNIPLTKKNKKSCKEVTIFVEF